MSRFYRSDSAERNWRTNIAFWIAGKELWAWKSKSNRMIVKMTEARIIQLVEKFWFNEELGFSFEQAKEDLLTLIKGEK